MSSGPRAEESATPSSVDLAVVDEGDGHWTIRVQGELDVAGVPETRRCLAELFDRRPTRVVLDLSAMTFIDSSGLGVLVSALKRARELGDTALVLRKPQDTVHRVFEITGLSDVFQIEH